MPFGMVLCYPVSMSERRELDAREPRVVGIADLTTGKVVLADGTTTEQFTAGIKTAVERLGASTDDALSGAAYECRCGGSGVIREGHYPEWREIACDTCGRIVFGRDEATAREKWAR